MTALTAKPNGCSVPRSTQQEKKYQLLWLFLCPPHTCHEVHAFTWSGMQAHQEGAGSLEPEWHAVENETQVLETELGSSASVTHVLTC